MAGHSRLYKDVNTFKSPPIKQWIVREVFTHPDGFVVVSRLIPFTSAEQAFAYAEASHHCRFRICDAYTVGTTRFLDFYTNSISKRMGIELRRQAMKGNA